MLEKVWKVGSAKCMETNASSTGLVVMFPVGSMPMLQNGGVHEAGHFSREHNLP